MINESKWNVKVRDWVTLMLLYKARFSFAFIFSNNYVSSIIYSELCEYIMTFPFAQQVGWGRKKDKWICTSIQNATTKWLECRFSLHFRPHSPKRKKSNTENYLWMWHYDCRNVHSCLFHGNRRLWTIHFSSMLGVYLFGFGLIKKFPSYIKTNDETSSHCTKIKAKWWCHVESSGGVVLVYSQTPAYSSRHQTTKLNRKMNTWTYISLIRMT